MSEFDVRPLFQALERGLPSRFQPNQSGYQRQPYTPVELYRAEDLVGQIVAPYTFYLQQIMAISGERIAVHAAALMMNYIENGYGRNIGQTISNMLHQAGRIAQEATIASYNREVVQKRKVPPYARPGRFSGGLLAALNSDNFYVASRDGISFGNVALLNESAAQWARLNYGAGAKGGVGVSAGEHDSFEGTYQKALSSFESSIGTVYFDKFYSAKAQSRFESFANHILNPGPRPAFGIPRGIWFAPGGGPQKPAFSSGGSVDEFYPYGQAVGRLSTLTRGALKYSKSLVQQPRPTAGIQPRRYLDAGIRTLYVQIERGTVSLVARQLKLAADRNIGAEAQRFAVEGSNVVTIHVDDRPLR